MQVESIPVLLCTFLLDLNDRVVIAIVSRDYDSDDFLVEYAKETKRLYLNKNEVWCERGKGSGALVRRIGREIEAALD